LFGIKSLNIAVIVLLLVCEATQKARAETDVIWGGVSVADDAIPFTPVGMMLLSDVSGAIDSAANARIAQKKFSNLNVLRRATSEQIEGVILTASLARESLEISKDVTGSTPRFYHVYRVFINLMAFDYDDAGMKGRYIGSVPLVVDYIDVKTSQASKTEQEQIFKSMYLDNRLEGLNVFDEIYKAANSLDVNGFPEKFAQVSEVSMSPEVAARIEPRSGNAEWHPRARQFFEAQLIKYSGSVLVPAMPEERMNREFKFVFSDRSRSITMPEPSGQINVIIEKLIPHQAVNGVQKTLCHGVVIKIQALDELDEEIMDRRFARVKKSCFVTHVDNVVDEPTYFRKSVLTLLKTIAGQFGEKVDVEWLQSFGVPSDVVAKYKKQIAQTKGQLLPAF
jgi:hypothetical protein